MTRMSNEYDDCVRCACDGIYSTYRQRSCWSIGNPVIDVLCTWARLRCFRLNSHALERSMTPLRRVKQSALGATTRALSSRRRAREHYPISLPRACRGSGKATLRPTEHSSYYIGIDTCDLG